MEAAHTLRAHAGAQVDDLNGVVAEGRDIQPLLVTVNGEMIDAAFDVRQRDVLHEREHLLTHRAIGRRGVVDVELGRMCQQCDADRTEHQQGCRTSSLAGHSHGPFRRSVVRFQPNAFVRTDLLNLLSERHRGRRAREF
jgi:hypothetical protein